MTTPSSTSTSSPASAPASARRASPHSSTAGTAGIRHRTTNGPAQAGPYSFRARAYAPAIAAHDTHPTDAVGDDLLRTYARGISRLEAVVRDGLERGLDPARLGTEEQAAGDATLAYRSRQLAQARGIVAELERQGTRAAPVIAARAYHAGMFAVDRVSTGRGTGLRGAFGGVHQRAVSVLAGNMSTSLERAARTAGQSVEAVFARANALEAGVPPAAFPFVGRRINDPWRRVALDTLGEGLVTLDTRRQISAALARNLVTHGVTDALTGYVDRAGRRWGLGTYAAMVTRTTTREATSRAAANRMAEHGLDLVTVSSHGGTCEICADYDGNTYSLSGQDDRYEPLDELPPWHPNCVHVITPAGSNLDDYEAALEQAVSGKVPPAPAEEVRPPAPPAAPAPSSAAATVAQALERERAASLERTLEQSTGTTAEQRAGFRRAIDAGEPVGPLAPDVLNLEARFRQHVAEGRIPALDELGVRNVGTVVRELVADRRRTAAAEHDDRTLAAGRARADAEAEYQRLRRVSLDTLNDETYPAHREALRTAREQFVNADAGYRTALEEQAQARTKATLELLGEVREGYGGAELNVLTTRGEGLRSVKEAAGYYPAEWISASNELERGFTVKLNRRGRGFVTHDGTEMQVNGKLGNAIHELGHRLEKAIPNLRYLEAEFWRRRTEGEASKWLGSGYGRHEVARPDKFFSKYVGKDYGGTNESSYEVLTMGVESLFTNRYGDLLEADPDHAAFILGLLAAF